MFRDALIENGIDPDDLLGERSNNQVSFGQLDEIRSVLEQCIPAVISQSAETLLLPVLLGISLQVCTHEVLQCAPTAVVGFGIEAFK